MWKRNRSDDNTGSYDFSQFSATDPIQVSVDAGLDPASDAFATQLVDRIFRAARARNASDIHIDAIPEGNLLRLRIEGRLESLGNVRAGKSTSITARIKALAGLLTYKCDAPQEGRLVYRELAMEARVVTLPTLHGERIVIRIGGHNQRDWRLEDLGLDMATYRTVQQAIRSPSGVILVSGPVGSGKTTTAYSVLRSLIQGGESNETARRCIVTLEDPIECELDKVAQSQIDPSTGFDWSAGLRALLRQDPEVLFIGEIRDAETAQVAYRAAMTGQLVVTTMHARSVVDALLRLIDLKVPTQHILAATQLIACQRLLRKRCSCHIQDVPQPEIIPGCQDCDFTGYQGRIPVVEAIGELEDELARAISSGQAQQTLQQLAIASGMRPLLEASMDLVRQKITTEREVLAHIRIGQLQREEDISLP